MNDSSLKNHEIYTKTNDHDDEELILNLISKPPKIRNVIDKSILQNYLENTDLIRKLQYDGLDSISIKKMTFFCSSFIELHEMEEGNILFREGDFGDKFYIIIKGSVIVQKLIQKDSLLTAEEYFKHLIQLQSNHENENFRRTVKLNHHFFPIMKEDYEYLAMVVFKFKLRKIMLGKNRNPKEIQELFNEHNINQEDFEIEIPELAKNLQGLRDSRINMGHVRARNSRNFHHFDYSKYVYFFNDKEKKKVKLLENQHVTTLKQGDSFGNIAIESKNGLRTATIISKEKTFLGKICQRTYKEHILVEKHKINTRDCLFFVDNYFPSINFRIFREKYFDFFTEKEYCKSDIIIHQNDKSDKIFFIKEGEIEISVKVSLNELNDLMNLIRKHTKNQSKIHKDILIIDCKNTKMKVNHKLFIINTKQSMCLEESTLRLNSFFTAKVISARAKIYSISYENFECILRETEQCSKHINTIVLDKMDLLYERISGLKTVYLSGTKFEIEKDQYFSNSPEKNHNNLKKKEYQQFSSFNSKSFYQFPREILFIKKNSSSLKNCDMIDNLMEEVNIRFTLNAIPQIHKSDNKKIYVKILKNQTKHITKYSDIPKLIKKPMHTIKNSFMGNEISRTRTKINFNSHDSRINCFQGSHTERKKVNNLGENIFDRKLLFRDIDPHIQHIHTLSLEEKFRTQTSLKKFSSNKTEINFLYKKISFRKKIHLKNIKSIS